MRSLAAIVFAASIALVSTALAQDVSKDTTYAPSGTYRLQPSHSQLIFSIRHLGLTDYYGRFDKVSGTLNFDANEPEKSATQVTIDMTSLDTPSERLNEELKSSSTFATDQFPTATFKSTSIQRTGPDTGQITGELTLKGVTKPVTLDVVFNGGEHDPLNSAFALGFHATATIKRTDFGLTGMVWESLVGSDVKLDIEAMFEQEKE